MKNDDGERVFGLGASSAFVVGTVVGTGIYLKPALVAKLLPELWQVLLLWLLAGLFATSGAVVYTSLARNWPQTGGPYIYLQRTYGSWAGSLLLAADIFVARPAAVGALATGLGLVWGLSGQQILVLAAVVILCLTWIQLGGAKVQGIGQMVLTLLQLVPLLVILVACLAQGGGEVVKNATTPVEPQWAAAFLAVLWAYDGWYNITILGGEIKNPEGTIRKALVGGMVTVTLLYLALNLALYTNLNGKSIGAAAVPFVALLEAWRLPWFGMALQLALTFALLATLNGTLACGARMIVAGVEHGLIRRGVGRVPTALAPTFCFSLYCLGLLGLFGGLALENNLFDSLSELTAVVVTLLSGLTVTCLFHRSNFLVAPSLISKLCAVFYLSMSLLLAARLVIESNALALAGAVSVLVLGTGIWLGREPGRGLSQTED